tara:strand:- start:20 stop:463 length:444 start_codon:yes stop_codon:yes gene_type:complete
MTKEYDKLDNLLYMNDDKKHDEWAYKILDFEVGINPPNDWIQGHFNAANDYDNEAPHNHNLLWDMVENMLAWADTESYNHEWMVEMFDLGIEQSLDAHARKEANIGDIISDIRKTKDELRETILGCKQEIIEKTTILCDEYIEVLTS